MFGLRYNVKICSQYRLDPFLLTKNFRGKAKFLSKINDRNDANSQHYQLPLSTRKLDKFRTDTALLQWTH
ncbi:hypothetical protein TSAR_016447 [Trichomalopsis sarcophagae]|uniref:Uncharacterized protein n=1 Tax=Trichomalopsis sarcophagae TaxID=543379 RepID=A0A232F4S1_9HYME|nr:hypothetical protein TSAR_016447 [Trichomalopsis sarcophagae]